jgi:hypothetical protein
MSDRRTQTRLFPPGDYADRLSALWAALQAAAEDETPRLATEAGAVEELRGRVRGPQDRGHGRRQGRPALRPHGGA